jgi:hypothetical protein
VKVSTTINLCVLDFFCPKCTNLTYNSDVSVRSSTCFIPETSVQISIEFNESSVGTGLQVQLGPMVGAPMSLSANDRGRAGYPSVGSPEKMTVREVRWAWVAYL